VADGAEVVSTNRPERDVDADGRFAVWPRSGSDADARLYRAVTAKQAAERRARDDYEEAAAEDWPTTYDVRDEVTGQVWSVLVGVVAQPSFVALDAHEIQMPPAAHVLWAGRVLCEDKRLRGVPGDWPEGQTWISLSDVADGAATPADRCAACWAKAPGLVVAIREIGGRR
jgi:hypothetical protein